jgi:hypothetical protein
LCCATRHRSLKLGPCKCDEERPECLRCRQAGWKCPGYTKRFKFVDERTHLVALYRKKKYILEDVRSALDDSIKHDNLSDLNDFGPDQMHIYQQSAPHNTPSASLSMGYDQTLNALCYILDRPHTFSLFPIKSLGSFFQFIPCRIGRNLALDSSLSCLCSMYTGWRFCASHVSKTSVQLYTKSLKALRKCLAIPQLRAEPETICASIILQLCEVGRIQCSIHLWIVTDILF